MQMVILIYHITGASQSIPVYMHIRVLVSSYLFLNGFGTFYHSWTTGNVSFRRYAKVALHSYSSLEEYL